MEIIKKEEDFIKNFLLDLTMDLDPRLFMDNLFELITEYQSTYYDEEKTIFNDVNFISVFIRNLYKFKENEKNSEDSYDLKNLIKFVAKNLNLNNLQNLFEELNEILDSTFENEKILNLIEFISLFIIFHKPSSNSISDPNFQNLLSQIFEKINSNILNSQFKTKTKIHFMNFLNVLCYFKLLKKVESDKLQTFIEINLNEVRQKLESQEKDMNSFTNFDPEKILKLLKKNFTIKNETISNNVIETFIEIKSQTELNFRMEMKIKEIILKIRKLLQIKENLNEEEIDSLIEFHSEISELGDLESELDLNKILKKKFQKFFEYFNSMKSQIENKTKEVFQSKMKNDFISVEDKNFKFNSKTISDEENLNLSKYSYFKIVLETFPNFFFEYLQNLFDNFITHLTNFNYFITKQIENGSFINYKFEIKDNSNKFDLIENFGLFNEIISNIFKFLKITKNFDSNKKNILESNSYSVNYEIFYGSANKKTNGSAILAFSYNIQLYFNNFKKILSENLENFKSEFSEKKIKEIFLEFKSICQSISENFEEVRNFKFYDPNENFSYLRINKSEDSTFTKQFFKFRDLLNLSLIDAKELKITRLSFTDFLEKNFNIKFEKSEREEIFKKIQNLQTFSFLFDKLQNDLIISENFSEFLKDFREYLTNHEISENSKFSSTTEEKFSKIFSLIHLIINDYFKNKEFKISDYTDILILHNNIEALIFTLNFSFLFDFNSNKSFALNKEFFQKILIFLKNFSNQLINQIISFFISELITEFSKFESLEDIRFERNSKNIQKTIKSSIELLQKFVSNFVEYSEEKVFMFNLNYILSLYFDFLNRKILGVKDFNLDDVKVLINLCKNISNDLKRGIENIFDKNRNLSSHLKLEFTNMLEKNLKYKKFEEILFVLNANMKEIRNFLVYSNFNIHIDPIELVELIKSIFEDNVNRKNLIEFVNDKLYPK